jgi:hypothetical protein
MTKRVIPVKVIVKKIDKDNNLGLFYPAKIKDIQANTIIISPKQNQKSFLNTLIHEMFHKICPGWTESRINGIAGELTNVIWKQGYRKEY